MKRYIILTADIHTIGGCQNYLSGKCPYLESKGWDVFVLFAGISNGSYAFKSLAKYADGNIPILDTPPLLLPRWIQQRTLKQMQKIVGANNDYTETIIESHYDRMHIWGELLAAKLHAKHMCFNCNEVFRGEGKFYEPYLDFYWYKYQRKELFCITIESLKKLFDTFPNFRLLNDKRFRAAFPNPLQDVPCPAVESIRNLDWSICYIGRLNKNYVSRVITDVALFAKDHPDKRINFIIVGDASDKKESIVNQFSSVSNVIITFLGNLIPIPRILLSRTDVIIAGSGCAGAVANHDVPIIIPNPQSCLSNGLFEYENENALHLEKGRTYETFTESLTRVLVDKVHTYLPRKYAYKRLSPDLVYDEHMQMIKDSEQRADYYSADLIKDNKPYHLQSLLSRTKLFIQFYKINLTNTLYYHDKECLLNHKDLKSQLKHHCAHALIKMVNILKHK